MTEPRGQAPVAPIVAIIPVRGGSKGVPRKNVRDVAGRPLLTWSVADALESQRVTHVYVSTEDAELKAVALAAGARVIDRPAELAADTTSSEAVLEQALPEIARQVGEPRLVVFLQATCPIRTGADIDAAIAHLEATDADSLLSVSPSHAFLWEERGGTGVAINYDSRRRPRRQDMNPQYRENGSIYVFKPAVLREFHNRLGGRIVLFKMGEEAGIDIDSEADLAVADGWLRRTAGEQT